MKEPYKDGLSNLSYEEWVAYEADIDSRFEALIEDNIEIFAYLWRFGDGDGGSVLHSIRSALLSKGAIKPRAEKVVSHTVIERRRITNKIRHKVYNRDNYQCKICSSIDDLVIDHIHPLCAGGTSDINNLQTLCGKCNAKKGRKVGY